MDGEALPFDAGFKKAIHGVQKVAAMRLNVEADEIGSEQPVEQFLPPRADAERLRVGPRDVPEDGHAGVGSLGLDERRQPREVVVLDEQQWLLDIGDFVEDGVGELLIHALVVMPVARPKHRARVRDMTERPKTFVGEAEVVAVLFLRAEPDAPQGVLRLVGWDAKATPAVDDVSVCVAGSVSNPGPIACAKDRLERGDQAAGGHENVNAASAPYVHIGLAVGDDDQAAAVETIGDRDPQAFGCPQRIAGLAETGFFFGRCPRGCEALGETGRLGGNRIEKAGRRGIS